MTWPGGTEPPAALRGRTAANQLSRVLDNAAPTGRCCYYTSRLRLSSSHLSDVCVCRWRAEPWLPCSASCGGGAQTRTVRCLRASEGGWSEGGANACLAAGRKPANSRLCNQQPCAGWSATRWGPVSSACSAPRWAELRGLTDGLGCVPVSRSVRGPGPGQPAPPPLLPARQRRQSLRADLQRPPQVSWPRPRLAWVWVLVSFCVCLKTCSPPKLLQPGLRPGVARGGVVSVHRHLRSPWLPVASGDLRSGGDGSGGRGAPVCLEATPPQLAALQPAALRWR